MKIDKDKLSRLLTQISEEKYHGLAFTLNFMVDVFAEEIAERIQEVIKEEKNDEPNVWHFVNVVTKEEMGEK